MALLTEVAAYPVDGLALLFNRQPPFVGYEAPVVASFQAATGFDAFGVGADDEAWLRHRSRAATQLLQEIRAALPDQPLTTWVFGTRAQNLAYGLDVETWIRTGLIDTVIPYSSEPKGFSWTDSWTDDASIGYWTELVSGTDRDELEASEAAGSDQSGALRPVRNGPNGPTRDLDATVTIRAMDTKPQDTLPLPDVVDPNLSRRGFLRGAAIAGGGVAAVSLAACAPATTGAGWTFGPPLSAAASVAPSPSAVAVASATPAHGTDPVTSPSPSSSGPIPPGWTDHDVQARNVVRRYIGNLAPALKGIYGEAAFLKLADILGVEDDYPELTQKPAFLQVPQLVLTDALKPLTPELDGDVKVFRLTIDEFEQHIDEKMPPVAALGYNSQWPGPTIRVNQGDKVRAIFTNNLKETTGVHFHGVEFADFFQDGVPFVTQKPITPGETYTYEFTALNAGSLMYHSHHNATDQVGRGLLGAFIVEPKVNPVKYDREYIWISNDSLGGFTINGHGFPAVVPVLAAVGEKVLVRFMNEGTMMHPWHLHGMSMRVVARDGWPLEGASFTCDTLGVNPGERFDVLVDAKTPGVWAFHCHILSHAEGPNGMFGMVTALIVVPEKAHVDAIVNALLA